MKVKLRKLKVGKRQLKLQIELLRTNSDIQKQYDVKERNMFNKLDEMTDIEQEWESYKTTLITAATNIIYIIYIMYNNQRAEDEPKVNG